MSKSLTLGSISFGTANIKATDLAIHRLPNGQNETFVADVKRFTEIVDCTTDCYNVRQIGLYIGLQLEELGETLEALGWDVAYPLLRELKIASAQFKCGEYSHDIARANRKELLDSGVDTAWVTIGAMLSQGADVVGAIAEVGRKNLAKAPDGVVLKDANGKVIKPEGWTPPDLSPFVCAGEAVNA